MSKVHVVYTGDDHVIYSHRSTINSEYQTQTNKTTGTAAQGIDHEQTNIVHCRRKYLLSLDYSPFWVCLNKTGTEIGS